MKLLIAEDDSTAAGAPGLPGGPFRRTRPWLKATGEWRAEGSSLDMDALSSAVGLKVDFDMALLVVASGLYRLLAQRMRGYSDAQARHLFRDIIDIPADISIEKGEVRVQLHRRSHLPITLDSGLMNQPFAVPWWEGLSLRLTARDALKPRET